MARQNAAPVQFERTTRVDTASIMTSGYSGVGVPFCYVPILRGDSASGSIACDIELGDMPRPLLNGAILNVQAWFVPKSAHPQFAGHDEFLNSYQGTQIKALGQPDRDPPEFFQTVTTQADLTKMGGSTFFRTLGVHTGDAYARPMNTDLLDAYTLIFNFRQAAHSDRLPRRLYASEDLDASLELAPAFWPTGNNRIVPDYERALVVGALDLDVTAGALPVSGITRVGTSDGNTIGTHNFDTDAVKIRSDNTANQIQFAVNDSLVSSIQAEMTDQSITTSLADIDKARTTQAFAKLRNSFAGNDHTGFDSDDAIVAELMQGFAVPADQFQRPILLDSARVPLGFAQRFSTDSTALEKSLSTGVASASLRINLPTQETGGTILALVELLPEKLMERESDEWLHLTGPSALPDALADVQRVEPVDLVFKNRIDARHTDQQGLFGYEPMNNVWNRERTRLGGVFYQADPANPFVEQRSALWQANIVDPEFSADHWLAPVPFPQYVFADPTAPAFELVGRHAITIRGLLQQGDMLAENNDDYAGLSTPADGVHIPGET